MSEYVPSKHEEMCEELAGALHNALHEMFREMLAAGLDIHAASASLGDLLREMTIEAAAEVDTERRRELLGTLT